MKQIYIANSSGLVILASGLYLIICIACCLCAWPWWLTGLIFYFIYLDYTRVIKLYGLRTSQNSVASIIKDCDKWQYELFSGKRYKARLIKHLSYCSPLVLIMCLRSMTCVRYVVIPRDSLSKHNYRFLALYINS